MKVGSRSTWTADAGFGNLPNYNVLMTLSFYGLACKFQTE